MLAEELAQVEVELRVRAGPHPADARTTCWSCEVGDVITLGTSEGTSLPVFVQGKAKMTGQPRIEGGSVALEIDRGPVNEIRRPFEQKPETTPARNTHPE